VESHFDLLVNMLFFWAEGGLRDILDDRFCLFDSEGGFVEVVIDDLWYSRKGKLLFEQPVIPTLEVSSKRLHLLTKCQIINYPLNIHSTKAYSFPVSSQ